MINFYAPNPKIKAIENKTIKTIVMVVGYVFLVLFPAICYFILEYIHFINKERFWKFVSDRVQIIVFSLIIFYLIFAAILFIVKRGWIAALLFGGVISAISVTNYYKFMLTGDNFYPWDLIQQTSNVSILITYLNTPFPVLYIMMIALVFLITVFLAVSKVGIPIKWFVRMPVALLIGVCMLFSVATPERAELLLNKNGLFFEDMALQQSNYESNGFTGATIINLLSNNIAAPENYSEKNIRELLSSYTYIPAVNDYVNPDIIVILSESYWDIRNLPDTEFSINPLENFDSVTERDNCYSGLFFTTGFGGGTVRPEFELLTGLTTDYLPGGAVPYQYINSDFDSYVKNYKDIGYKAVMLHPYLSNFYMRDQKFGYLGFDELYFHDDLLEIAGVEPKFSGNQISDDSFIDYIKYLLDSESDYPSFIFGITMENHQPYPDKYKSDLIEVTVTNTTMDEDTLSAVTNFTQGLINADRSLGKLIDYVDSRETPTIVVFFGDHAPSLGANYAAYFQSGLIADTSSITQAERYIIQSTPYMIYANYNINANEANESMIKSGKNNNIASYNVLNALAVMIGSPRTEYMQFLQNYYETANYYNIRLNLDITVDMSYYIENHKLLTYDRISGMKYSFFSN